MIYLQLFLSFAKIGLFAFGGGYAILSLIQHEIVVGRGWLTQSELADIVAISQMTPGPIGINSATYVGYVASGSVWGAVVATLAIMLPSFVIMLCLSRFVLAVRGNKYMGYVLDALRPTVVGLIAAAALMLMNGENFVDWRSILLFVAVFVLSFRFRVHPILLIVLAGVAGMLLY